jgi:hypothetical protein
VKAQFILNIDERGITATRCDGLIPDFTISVEQQAANPVLGLICHTSDVGEAVRAIMRTACLESAIVGTLDSEPVAVTGATHFIAAPASIAVKVERINMLEPSKKFALIDHTNGDGSRELMMLTPEEGKYLAAQLSKIFLEQ